MNILTKTGFNPNANNGFGAGLACGILFVWDLPMTIVIAIINVFLPANSKLTGLGLVAWRSMWGKHVTIGMLMGFLLLSVGIGGYFNKASFIGFEISYQVVWFILAITLGIIDVIANIYRNIATKK